MFRNRTTIKIPPDADRAVFLSDLDYFRELWPKFHRDWRWLVIESPDDWRTWLKGGLCAKGHGCPTCARIEKGVK